jgi:hypothetical protein
MRGEKRENKRKEKKEEEGERVGHMSNCGRLGGDNVISS